MLKQHYRVSNKNSRITILAQLQVHFFPPPPNHDGGPSSRIFLTKIPSMKIVHLSFTCQNYIPLETLILYYCVHLKSITLCNCLSPSSSSLQHFLCQEIPSKKVLYTSSNSCYNHGSTCYNLVIWWYKLKFFGSILPFLNTSQRRRIPQRLLDKRSPVYLHSIEINTKYRTKPCLSLSKSWYQNK